MTALIALLARQAVNVLNVSFQSFGPITEVGDRSVVDDPDTSLAETTVLTLQFAGLHGVQSPRALREMVTARNVHEFGDGVRLLAGHLLNRVVADVEGNLAYFTSGDIWRPDILGRPG